MTYLKHTSVLFSNSVFQIGEERDKLLNIGWVFRWNYRW